MGVHYARWLLEVDSLLYRVFNLGAEDLIQDVVSLRDLYMEGLTPVQAAADHRLDFVVYPYKTEAVDQPESWYRGDA